MSSDKYVINELEIWVYDPWTQYHSMCIGMCATPVGQAIYGGLFEVLKGKVFGLFFIVTLLVVLLAFAMKKPFARLAEYIER